MEGKYLITTDNWFIAPDGKEYKAAWGEVTILEDNILGIKTNMRSTNWYAKIGSEDNHIVIAGCQIHYAVKCENTPFTMYGEAMDFHEGKLKTSTSPTKIYIAE